jgi:hypothetical protein
VRCAICFDSTAVATRPRRERSITVVQINAEAVVQLEQESMCAVLDRTNTIKLTTIVTQILRTLIFHVHTRPRACSSSSRPP